MKEIKATLGESKRNGKDFSKKEMVSAYTVVVDTERGLQTPVSAKCYMGKSNQASVVYVTFRCSDNEKYFTAGHGQAGGWGYHKESQAIENAIESAGIKLSADIGGRGETAIENALFAITEALGYTGKNIIVKV